MTNDAHFRWHSRTHCKHVSWHIRQPIFYSSSSKKQSENCLFVQSWLVKMTRLSLEERQEEPKKHIQLSRLSVEINGLCMQVYGEQQNTLWQLVWHFVWFLQWMLTLSIWAKNWVKLIFHQVELSWVFESFIPMIPIYYP